MAFVMPLTKTGTLLKYDICVPGCPYGFLCVVEFLDPLPDRAILARRPLGRLTRLVVVQARRAVRARLVPRWLHNRTSTVGQHGMQYGLAVWHAVSSPRLTTQGEVSLESGIHRI